jgi:hypothetical protein
MIHNLKSSLETSYTFAENVDKNNMPRELRWMVKLSEFLLIATVTAHVKEHFTTEIKITKKAKLIHTYWTLR